MIDGLRTTSRGRAGSRSSVSINEVELGYHIEVPLVLLRVLHELRDDYII
jgi:hypothetical protein